MKTSSERISVCAGKFQKTLSGGHPLLRFSGWCHQFCSVISFCSVFCCAMMAPFLLPAERGTVISVGALPDYSTLM
jgi:hypothetical protein